MRSRREQDPWVQRAVQLERAGLVARGGAEGSRMVTARPPARLRHYKLEARARAVRTELSLTRW